MNPQDIAVFYFARFQAPLTSWPADSLTRWPADSLSR